MTLIKTVDDLKKLRYIIEEEDEFESELDISSVLKYKRYHYIIMCYFCSFIFVALLEFSFTESFQKNLEAFILLLFLIETMLTYSLQTHMLKENLLI